MAFFRLVPFHLSDTCGRCGTANNGLPPHLKGNIQYHPGIGALVAYMSARQYVPHNRIAETMRHVFNQPISEGTIDNMLSSIADAAAPMYDRIQLSVAASEVIGGDETGIRIDGEKAWLFTLQGRLLTFIAVSYSRGLASIQRLFANGFPLSMYVTDCLAAQLKTPARLHQICIVHLLRELNNFVDAFGCQW